MQIVHEGFVMRRLCMFFLMIFIVSGCSPKEHYWNEDIQLQSGQILSVKRAIAFKKYQPAGGGGGADILVSTLQFNESDVNSGMPKLWAHPPFLPMLVDQDPENHEWFIVATFYMCTVWYEIDRPKLPYVEFRYRDGEWVKQKLSEKFVGRKGNMLVPGEKDVNSDHTLESKRHLMDSPGIDKQYQYIVSNWETNC